MLPESTLYLVVGGRKLLLHFRGSCLRTGFRVFERVVCTSALTTGQTRLRYCGGEAYVSGPWSCYQSKMTPTFPRPSNQKPNIKTPHLAYLIGPRE